MLHISLVSTCPLANHADYCSFILDHVSLDNQSAQCTLVIFFLLSREPFTKLTPQQFWIGCMICEGTVNNFGKVNIGPFDKTCTYTHRLNFATTVATVRAHTHIH